MLDIIQTPIEYEYEIKDCRSLNRMEMIGFISCDIMSRKWDEDILNDFRYIYKGITRGPWTIQCDPADNSISYIIDNYVGDNYKVKFVPHKKGMTIMYYKEDLIASTFWDIDDIEDNLI
jgi:hypothetical protein